MPLDATTDSVSRKAFLEQIKKRGEKMFDRGPMMSLFQTLAENFHPIRADFTIARNDGDELTDGLMSSYPIVARRDLGNAFSAMLRPKEVEWFKARTMHPDREDTSARKYLEQFTSFQRNAMYDDIANFVAATREADHDYVTFGQACIQTELVRPRTGMVPHLLYRCRHLRDVAWCEGATGQIDTIYRRDKLSALDLSRLFPGRIHRKVDEKLKGGKDSDPYHLFNVWHCVLPSDVYREMPGARPMMQPYVSVYYDVDNEHEMECIGQWTRGYVIPRWERRQGSPYAYSPAMIAALPDARLLQAVTLVLLEAGEKTVNPPKIATEDVVRSDIADYPGGTTWVSEEYDERLGEALRPMTIDAKGLGFAMELVRDIRFMLRDAMYLSKLDLPPMVTGDKMTAYEIAQRVQENIRNMLPLFEPVEVDYSGWICRDTSELLLRNSPEFQNAVPRSLDWENRKFQFESPLKAAMEKAKAGQFIEAQQIIAASAQNDPTVALLMDTRKAARDVLHGVARADWMRNEDEVEQIVANQKAQEQQERLMALMSAGTKIAKTGAEAAATASEALPQFGLS